MYSCKRCGYSSKYKCNLKSHLFKKKICKPILQNISINKLRDELTGIGQSEFTKDNESNSSEDNDDFKDQSQNNVDGCTIVYHDSNKFFKCAYCDKMYSKNSNLRRHQRKCDGEVQNNVILNIMEKQIEVMKAEQLKQIEKIRQDYEIERNILHKQIEGLLEKVGTCNNTTNQTINIKEQKIIMNSFGKENVEYLTKAFMQELLKIPYVAVPKLIKNVHFHPEHPENHNVKITNKKLPYASVWNGKNGWELRNKKEVIENMVDKSYSLIETEYEKTDLGNVKPDKFKNFQKKFNEEDKEVHKMMVKDSELVILNESK